MTAARGSATILLTGTLLALMAACRIGPSTQTQGATDEGESLHDQIDEILRLSAEAWNGGDLAGFMVHYERAPTTTYIGGGGLRTGFDEIQARYAPDFATGAVRDSLRFVDLSTRALDRFYALATARYILYQDGETTSTGPFTLVLHRVEGAWKIIHDQSAADPPAEVADETEEEPGA